MDHAMWYRSMQTEKPVHYDPAYTFLTGHKGGWQVFLHEDVQQALLNHTGLSNSFIPPNDDIPVSRGLTQADEPRHKYLRSMLSGAFSSRAIAAMRPFILAQCHALVDRFIAAGETDFPASFGFPLPVAVIEHMLQVSFPSSTQVHRWTRAITGEDVMINGPAAFMRAQEEMTSFFTPILNARQQHPGADMISGLFTTAIDGEKTDYKDVMATCHLMIAAGTETTSSLLSNTIYVLTALPHLQERLATQPQDIPKLIQETLRYYSSLQNIPRLVKATTVIRGHSMAPGELVNLWSGAANFDPAVFPDPLTFDIDRPNHIRVISFGHGIHYCLGAQLAKLEAETALQVILERIKDIRLKDPTLIQQNKSTLSYALDALPVVFNAR